VFTEGAVVPELGFIGCTLTYVAAAINWREISMPAFNISLKYFLLVTCLQQLDECDAQKQDELA